MLDGCCGTGDLAVACLRAGAGAVVGLDFSPRMIERARRKSAAVAWIEGDLLSLPFEDGQFDSATVGFGVRNVADLERALCELARVLVSDGRLGILEITQPTGTLRRLLPSVVRSDRAAARTPAERRLGLCVPARERSPISR